MFAIIETKGANHIAIHIPHQGAEKTLPALAAMLEQNAVFIKRDWRSAEVVKPEMTISLGNTYSVGGDSDTPDIMVAESSAVIAQDFVNWTPEVKASYTKVIASKDKEIERLKAELSMAKMDKDRLQEQINAMAAED